MMIKTKSFFLLLALVISFTVEKGLTKECPQNQHYTFCGASCQANCADRNVIKQCNKKCVADCICDAGYVLEHEDSQSCVLKENCDSCPENAYYSACDVQCQRTCNNYNQASFPCPDMCAPGCVCNKGFVNHKGDCILPSECRT
ncbi:alpha-tectorin-like [Lissotriton helveticus]